MAASRYTKGLWMGGKWSTWWYRFIWSAIWVFLLSGFLGDQALLWLTRYSHLGLLFQSLFPSVGVKLRNEISGLILRSFYFFITEMLSSFGEETAFRRLIWSSHTAFHYYHSFVTSDGIIDLIMQKNCYLIGKPHKHQSIIHSMCVFRWFMYTHLHFRHRI